VTIHLTFKISIRSTSKRVEKVSAPILDVDSDHVTTGFVRRIRIAHQQMRIFRHIVDAKHSVKVTQTTSQSDRSRPNSYPEIEDDVAVSIHLDHVFKLGVGNNGDGSIQRSDKFQRETYTALMNEAEVIVLTQIGSQIKGIQRIPVSEILTT